MIQQPFLDGNETFSAERVPDGLVPRRVLLLGSAAAVALPLAPAAKAQFRVEVSGVGGTQVPITIAAFRDEGEGAQAVSAIIRADLERSGSFRLLPTAERLDERSTVSPADWRGKGSDALVVGSMLRAADGRVDLRYRLWDTVKGEAVAGGAFTVPAADTRLQAHRIADEIHLKLTGVPGVFATRVAYVVKAGSRYTLYVTDADGENRQVALTSLEPIISPAWSPDGKRLAYVSFEQKKASVWVQELATGERRQVANFRGSNSAPAFSADGRNLALALSRDGATQLYSLPLAAGPNAAPTRLTSSGAIDTEPVFSADGKQLYFVSDRGGGPQIYRMPAAGGNAERVSFQGSYNISPSLSPDGRHLAYIARQGAAYRLALLELETGAVRMLSDTSDDERPSFSPNGRLVVYSTHQRGTDVLMTSTLDGKIKTRLLGVQGDLREPAWGPFGR